jgi:hypothetical protein
VKSRFYASDPDKVQFLKIDPTGKISVFVADPRILFGDEMWIDAVSSDNGVKTAL